MQDMIKFLNVIEQLNGNDTVPMFSFLESLQSENRVLAAA